jgi:hypothetical protein
MTDLKLIAGRTRDVKERGADFSGVGAPVSLLEIVLGRTLRNATAALNSGELHARRIADDVLAHRLQSISRSPSRVDSPLPSFCV